jgi:chromosome segregation ATPase
MTKEQILQALNIMPTEDDVTQAFKDIAEWVDEVTAVLSNHSIAIKDLAYRVDGAEDTPDFENAIKVIEKDLNSLDCRLDEVEGRTEDVGDLESRIEDLESKVDDLPDLDNVEDVLADHETSFAWVEEKLEKLENIVDIQQKTISNLVSTVNSLRNAISAVNNTLPHQTPVHVPLNQWKWTCSGNTQSS